MEDLRCICMLDMCMFDMCDLSKGQPPKYFLLVAILFRHILRQELHYEHDIVMDYKIHLIISTKSYN